MPEIENSGNKKEKESANYGKLNCDGAFGLT